VKFSQLITIVSVLSTIALNLTISWYSRKQNAKEFTYDSCDLFSAHFDGNC
jgi:hypothetical protein